MAGANADVPPCSKSKDGKNFPKPDDKFVERWRKSLSDPQRRLQLARLLAKTLIFADTSEEFRLLIVDAIVPVEYRAAQVVFHHGEEGDWMAIVLQGRVERRLQRQNSEICIGDAGPGGIIGDLGVFGINPTRSFTVLSITQSQLLIISRDALDRCASLAGGPALSLFQNGQEMQNLMADSESFMDLPCFRKLDRDFVMTLRENSEPRLCYPNQVLMKEHAYGNEMYILRAGKVKIERSQKLIAELSSGVVLGELAVLGSDKRRTATVTCTTLCLIRVLHGDVFHEILNSFPRAKRVFDHAYIARLVHIEMQTASEDLKKLDNFYGSARPRTDDEMVQLFGATPKSEQRPVRMQALPDPNKKLITLPKIASPRGLIDSISSPRKKKSIVLPSPTTPREETFSERLLMNSV